MQNFQEACKSNEVSFFSKKNNESAKLSRNLILIKAMLNCFCLSPIFFGKRIKVTDNAVCALRVFTIKEAHAAFPPSSLWLQAERWGI